VLKYWSVEVLKIGLQMENDSEGLKKLVFSECKKTSALQHFNTSTLFTNFAL
jgi:hypothetical protein